MSLPVQICHVFLISQCRGEYALLRTGVISVFFDTEHFLTQIHRRTYSLTTSAHMISTHYFITSGPANRIPLLKGDFRLVLIPKRVLPPHPSPLCSPENSQADLLRLINLYFSKNQKTLLFPLSIVNLNCRWSRCGLSSWIFLVKLVF